MQKQDQNFWKAYAIVSILVVGLITAWGTVPTDAEIRREVCDNVTIPFVGDLLMDSIIRIESHGVYKVAYIDNKRVAVAFCGVTLKTDR